MLKDTGARGREVGGGYVGFDFAEGLILFDLLAVPDVPLNQNGDETLASVKLERNYAI